MELEHEAYKFKISEKEYESLREEIIQRIILINTQANNTSSLDGIIKVGRKHHDMRIACRLWECVARNNPLASLLGKRPIVGV